MTEGTPPSPRMRDRTGTPLASLLIVISGAKRAINSGLSFNVIETIAGTRLKSMDKGSTASPGELAYLVPVERQQAIEIAVHMPAGGVVEHRAAIDRPVGPALDL